MSSPVERTGAVNGDLRLLICIELIADDSFAYDSFAYDSSACLKKGIKWRRGSPGNLPKNRGRVPKKAEVGGVF